MPRLGMKKLREKYTTKIDHGFLKVSPVVDLLPRQQRARVYRAIQRSKPRRVVH